MRHLGKVQGTLAFLVVIVFVTSMWFLLKNDIDRSMRDALLIMVGSLGSAFGAVMNYYFGSSSGSAAKTELLSKDPHA